jgi:hypothetical protein
MHTVKDTRVFVESLNLEQRRALACALLLYKVEEDNGERETSALATRLCEAILLARTVSQMGGWRAT